MSSNLPSPEGIPKEMETGTLPYSLPPETKSTQIRIQPSNISTIVSNTQTIIAGAYNELTFPIQNLIFDIPCGASPSQFLDQRATTLSFRTIYEIVATGAGNTTQDGGVLRSNASSWFDRLDLVGQNGNYIESIPEYGVVADTLINLQMSNSSKDGVSTAYGFNGSNAVGPGGHVIGIFAGAAKAFAAGQVCSHSYSVPVISGVIGAGADSFLNIGRTSKLQAVFQTAAIAPVSILAGAGAGSTIKITLTDFTLSMEYVDIGPRALGMLDQSLQNGMSYVHGLSYKCATNTLPSVAGAVSLLAGIRGSSVKSLFARFHDTPLTAAGSINGKYDSKLPMLSQVNFNIGGSRYPQIPIPALTSPAMLFREAQNAIGSFNSSEYSYGGNAASYCKLSAGGSAQGVALNSQDYNYNLGTDIASQALAIVGTSTETIARKGLLSGLNCNSAPIFLEMTIATAPTNVHNVYVIAQMDQIICHDTKTGDIQVRI